MSEIFGLYIYRLYRCRSFDLLIKYVFKYNHIGHRSCAGTGRDSWRSSKPKQAISCLHNEVKMTIMMMMMTMVDFVLLTCSANRLLKLLMIYCSYCFEAVSRVSNILRIIFL